MSLGVFNSAAFTTAGGLTFGAAATMPSQSPTDHWGPRYLAMSAKIGPIVLAVQERETIYIPIILSAAALALGVALLLTLRGR